MKVKPLSRVMHFGSGLYLLGLLTIAILSISYGFVGVRPDKLLPYECFLLIALIVWNFAKAIRP